MTLPLLLSRDGLTKKHGLVVKKGCVIIVMTNLFLATVVTSCSYSWLKIMCRSYNSILVRRIGAVVEDANWKSWQFSKSHPDFDHAKKVILKGGEWYVLNMHGHYVHGLQAEMEDLFKLVRILLVGDLSGFGWISFGCWFSAGVKSCSRLFAIVVLFLSLVCVKFKGYIYAYGMIRREKNGN